MGLEPGPFLQYLTDNLCVANGKITESWLNSERGYKAC